MKPIGHTILRYDEVTSTNTLLLGNTSLLECHGLVMVARHQTAGRGRMGRVWASLPGAQLQFSTVVHPNMAEAEVPLISLISGLAVVTGIHAATGLRPTLRWPNDVFLDGRKVSGILVEAKLGVGGKTCLVIGIGINCQGRAEDFPPDVRAVLTTLSESLGKPVDNERVLHGVLAELQTYLDRLTVGERGALLDEWLHWAPIRGARVRVPAPQGPVAATVQGLTAEGYLSALDETGRLHTVVSSGVEWL